MLTFWPHRAKKRHIGITRIAGLLALLGIAAVLAACGVSGTVDPVANAANKTEQSGGVKMAMSIDVASSGKTYSITADGLFDHQQGQLTIDLSGALQSAGVPALDAGAIKLLYLKEDGDPVVYLNIPALADRIPGKAWLRLDLAKAGKSLGVNLDQLLSQANQNPAQTLDLLRSVGQVDKIGSATINGVSTTDYKGTIDLAKAAARKGSDAEQMVQRLIAQGAPAELPVEVWIGDDGLVRRLRLDEDLQAGGSSLSAAVTIDLSDFGTDVSVAAPPADQVFDVTTFAAATSSP